MLDILFFFFYIVGFYLSLGRGIMDSWIWFDLISEFVSGLGCGRKKGES